MNAIDKAIDDLGAVWSVDCGSSDTYFIVDDQLWMRSDDWFDGMVCTRTEFEARVVERKLLKPLPPPGYEWGKNYPYNCKMPNLPHDTMVIARLRAGYWGNPFEVGKTKYLNDPNDSLHPLMFRIVDERYKPKTPDTDENFVPTDPSDMSRIDIIGQNGNTGEHYDKPTHPVTAVDFFTAGAEILNQRGQQYDSSGEAERSFPQVAQAFTAITGRQLSGSDVCLVLNLVKKIRQYAQPDRLHHDSLLDSVNYDALWAQELTRELSK